MKLSRKDNLYIFILSAIGAIELVKWMIKCNTFKAADNVSSHVSLSEYWIRANPKTYNMAESVTNCIGSLKICVIIYPKPVTVHNFSSLLFYK